MSKDKKRILFLTGTRADFGKLKSLMGAVASSELFEIHVFVTGMHMLNRFGYTCAEVELMNYDNTFLFMNQSGPDKMDRILAKTILGLSDYVEQAKPDMIVVHGDRVEALAGASVGSLNNILTVHVEGGERSGTIDELIRHAVSKLSHVHLVANQAAMVRLIQMGELAESVFVIGSPDVDLMMSPDLPSIESVKQRYDIKFSNYAIAMLHPVTTELDRLERDLDIFIQVLQKAETNFILIYPNNDSGSEEIIRRYQSLQLSNVRLIPSMRFEYFLSALKHAQFIIGNSSAGIREAPYYRVPAIDLGSRQLNRSDNPLIKNIDFDEEKILIAIKDLPQQTEKIMTDLDTEFGFGDSARKFTDLIEGDSIWKTDVQKQFVDTTQD